MTVTVLPPPADPVAVLGTVLDGLAAQVPADLPGAVALDRARALLAGAERVKTLALVALADVDRPGPQPAAAPTGAAAARAPLRAVTRARHRRRQRRPRPAPRGSISASDDGDR